MVSFINRLPGDPAPDFHQSTPSNKRFHFDTVGGRYIVMCFFLTVDNPHSQAALRAVASRKDLFDDDFASFFGVTTDPNDVEQQRVADTPPGYRFFLDLDMSVSKLYGAIDREFSSDVPTFKDTRRIWVVTDPTLRIMKVLPFKSDQSDCSEILSYLDSLPKPDHFAGMQLQAPIIVLPNVFEPELCAELIARYETEGARETGFMTEENGKTVEKLNPNRKRRMDHVIDDTDMIARLKERFSRRVMPEIAKVHQFHATRMERFIVGCYTAEDGGHFSAHRDDTTPATAHRRFAVSVNLNDEFDGGEVFFPEYGKRSFKAPAGGAVVFSCSLLHAVTKVTRGRRYAFLPFLYDDAAAEIRKSTADSIELQKDEARAKFEGSKAQGDLAGTPAEAASA